MDQATRRKELQRERHHKFKQALIESLGGVCFQCGEDDHAKLEFHHKIGKTWMANKLSHWTRLKKYQADIAAGLILLLCDDCHNQPTFYQDTCFCPHCRGDVRGRRKGDF